MGVCAAVPDNAIIWFGFGVDRRGGLWAPSNSRCRGEESGVLIKQDFQQALADVDVILGPTTPSPAWKIGAKSQDPVAMYLEDIYTLSVNLHP